MLALDPISSLGEALCDAVWTWPTALALIEVDRRVQTRALSFRDVRIESERVAAALDPLVGSAAGFEDALVAIVMGNQSRWLTTAIGAFWAGATLVPIDHKLKPVEQAGLLAHARPRVIVCEWPVWRELGPLLGGLDATVYVTEAPAGATLERGALAWPGDARETTAPMNQPARRLRDDIACVVYSSGTSGDVKGCMLTHGNYLAQAQALGGMYPMRAGDRYLSILPTNHAIDFMCGFLLPLLFGATIVHQRTLRPEFLRFTMQRYGITHVALVPAILASFRDRIEEQLRAQSDGRRALIGGLVRLNEALTLAAPKHWLSRRLLKPIHDGFGGRLRFVFAGGAFVDPSLASFFYDLGLPIAIGYGLTEAGTVLCVNDLAPFRPDTVGAPIAGVELEIRDADDEGRGEVWARSPTVMRGYFRSPERTAEAIVDGWLRTGDVGWLDASGHLHLVGRRRNMIVTGGGKNVYPEDVEAVFDGVGGAEELCVFAADYLWPRQGDLRGEALVVVARARPGADVDLLRAALAHRSLRLGAHKRVGLSLTTTLEFPRTASMKVKRDALADALRAHHSRSDAVPLKEPPR